MGTLELNGFASKTLCHGEKWCTYESTDHMSIIVQYVYLFFLLFYAIKIIYQSFKLYSKPEPIKVFGKVSVAVHTLLVLWFACNEHLTQLE